MNPRMYSQKESTIQRQYFQKMVKEQLEILIKKWTSTHMSHHTQKLIWNES